MRERVVGAAAKAVGLVVYERAVGDAKVVNPGANAAATRRT